MRNPCIILPQIILPVFVLIFRYVIVIPVVSSLFRVVSEGECTSTDDDGEPNVKRKNKGDTVMELKDKERQYDDADDDTNGDDDDDADDDDDDDEKLQSEEEIEAGDEDYDAKKDESIGKDESLSEGYCILVTVVYGS